MGIKLHDSFNCPVLTKDIVIQISYRNIRSNLHARMHIGKVHFKAFTCFKKCLTYRLTNTVLLLIYFKPRMHSSRMCTTRLSGRSGRGGRGVQGCVCVSGVSVWGCLSRGVYTQWTRRQTPSLHAGIHPHPLYAGIHAPHPLWTQWQTDGCKNITFPQLRLWVVKSWCTWRYEPGALAFLYLFQRSSKSWSVKATAFESVSVLHSRYLHKLVTRW